MQKLTNEELAALHDAKDWGALWLAARPLVKFTIKRMIQRGEIDPSRWADDDLKQEGLLAAGLAVRSWDTLEGAFSTWISTKVRGRLLDCMEKEIRGGFGGEGDTPFLVSAQEDAWIDNDADDEPDAIKQDALVYDEDEVIVSPETAMDRETARRLLPKLDPVDEELVRKLFGIDCEPQAPVAAALSTGVSHWRVRFLPTQLGRLLEKAGIRK